MKDKVLVETSARHIHVSQKDLDILYGEGYKLTNKKDLSQPGQFACEEKVEVVGPKGSMKMSILGPCRKQTQVEISLTDARTLGLKDVPVRESGDLAGSAPCKVIGPKGEIEISEGVIVAMRHIHFTPKDAQEFGIKEKEIVQVKVESKDRTLIFDDVVCRVRDDYALAMHIDVDEANAAGCSGEVYGTVIRK